MSDGELLVKYSREINSMEIAVEGGEVAICVRYSNCDTFENIRLYM
jgi:hypothetical protein